MFNYYDTEFAFTDEVWDLESIVLSDVRGYRKDPGFCESICRPEIKKRGGTLVEYEGIELIAIFPEH